MDDSSSGSSALRRRQERSGARADAVTDHPRDPDLHLRLVGRQREGVAMTSRRPILDQVEPLQTLAGVLRWALAQGPPAEVVNVVVQDEFTHDVVVRVAADVVLVFDTT